jgi:hypothetical protein
MPTPQGKEKEQWRLGWGPAVDDDNSNLMFAAEFMDITQKSPVPVFSAIVIRGTDVESEPAGLVKQLVEDLDAETQVPFPEHDPNARIAQGTQIGFQTLSQLTDQGRTVRQYVEAFLNANPAAPVVVTGHSLGGCQTTVMALNLALQFPGSIVPTTFAGPTAGNQSFVELYEQNCPFAPRWFNTRDLVPNAYASLDNIQTLWDACGHPAPLLLKLAVEGLKLLLEDVGAIYSQESDKNTRSVTSECRPAGASALPPTFQNQTVREIEAILLSVITKIQAKGKFAELVRKFEGDIRELKLIKDIPIAPAFGTLLDLVAGQLPLLAKLAAIDLFEWIEELMYQHLILTGYWNGVQNFPDVAFIPNPFPKAAAAGGNG